MLTCSGFLYLFYTHVKKKVNIFSITCVPKLFKIHKCTSIHQRSRLKMKHFSTTRLLAVNVKDRMSTDVEFCSESCSPQCSYAQRAAA